MEVRLGWGMIKHSDGVILEYHFWFDQVKELSTPLFQNSETLLQQL